MYVPYTQTTLEGWDPLAYFYAGQRLAEGKGLAFCHPYNARIGPYFTLSGFNVRLEDHPACLYLNYPPGFPALLALAYILTGDARSAFYVPAVLGALGVVLTFAVGAMLFDPYVGLVGAIILLFAPTFLQFSTSLWSDGPATTLMLGGIAAILAGERAQKSWWQVVAGGAGALLLGWSIFVRYANGVVLLPIAAYCGVKYGIRGLGKNHIRAFLLCSAGVILGVLMFNKHYYGGFFTSAYSPRHGWYEWPAFSVQYALGESPVGGRSLIGVWKTLWDNYAWLILIGVLGWAYMSTSQLALVLGDIMTFVGLYSFYAFAPVGINARFLIPVLPFIALSIGWAMKNAVPKPWQTWWQLIGIVSVIVILLIPAPGRLWKLAARNQAAVLAVENIKQLAGRTEPNAVILAYNTNDLIAFYGQRTTLFYRRIRSEDAQGLERQLVGVCTTLLKMGVPVYYVVDRDPPLGNSLTILERHFSLLRFNNAPLMYRLKFDTKE